MFVEVMRGFMVLLGTAAGYWLARDLVPSAPSAGGIGAMLGVLIGYISGGLLGRTTDRVLGVVERRVARLPGPQLVVGALGAIAGAVAGTILTLPLLLNVRPAISIPIAGIATWVLGALGFRIAASHSGDLFAAAGLSTRPLVRAEAFDPRDGYLLDTSALMDGRFAGLLDSGVIRDDLFVAIFVLDEIQGFADAGSEDPRARRARRGLETLEHIKSAGSVRISVLDDELPEIAQVDAKLVALAKRLSLRLLTADAQLASVAEIQGVPTLNLRRLAADLAPAVLAGERMMLRILKAGREPGQGVGFLDDGSMVIVNGGSASIGAEPMEIVVSSVVPNAAGRLIFAKPAVSLRETPASSGIIGK
ncbi:unannotated protein [freshwater metagenome]|uniref:Unannotated protein n=1 Tax=freshwater metagenome TaxID=449393 RepID=A0A6J7JGB8_9ZZZZ